MFAWTRDSAFARDGRVVLAIDACDAVFKFSDKWN